MTTIGTEAGFCSQTAELWQFAGFFIMIVKIVIPVALIIVGIITLGKAVISTDEGEAKKGFRSMLKKFVLAVLIFFIPSIIMALFSGVDGFNELKDDYNVCNICMTHPKGDYCTSKVLALEK